MALFYVFRKRGIINMLNMKKGLAVALAAATVLTFAPVSALAGTNQKDYVTNQTARLDTDTEAKLAEVIKSTMNETANVWSYDYQKGKDVTTETKNNLANQADAVVVLTPENPTGTVTFTKEITDSDTLASGTWYKKTDLTSTNDTDTDRLFKLTTSKYSKTLKIEANVAALRSLAGPTAYTISRDATNASTRQLQWLNTGAITVNGKSVDTDYFKVTIILAKTAVKMNNLKVTLSNASDTAYDRYMNHNKDMYDAFEARPKATVLNDGTANGAIDTNNSIDTALDGTPITEQELNLADASKDKTFKVESNADVIYESADNKIATIDKDGIHAKAVGSTSVTIKTKQTMTSYGDVTVTIPVKVINQPKAALNVPSDLTVTGYGVSNETQIGATGTNIQKNSIKYDFVYWDPINQTYISLRNQGALTYPTSTTKKINPYELDRTKDAVFVNAYPGNDDADYEWNAYLKVSATGAEGYKDPDPQYIKLHFKKDIVRFALDATSQNLHTGESVQITTKSVSAVTGAACTYKSWNPAVATVSDTGVIKAVGEGSTKVDVTYADQTTSVTVTVTNYENGNGSVSTPAKVTGVKVANVKGGKVKVTWTAADDSNVKYYVKKTVSGKSAGKSVGSNGTTLTVKKGATVKVKVKAYVYDNAGKKLVGAYSTTVTKKTDNK